MAYLPNICVMLKKYSSKSRLGGMTADIFFACLDLEQKSPFLDRSRGPSHKNLSAHGPAVGGIAKRLKSGAEEDISRLVGESLSSRIESERLPEQAKSRVEHLIEEAVNQ